MSGSGYIMFADAAAGGSSSSTGDGTSGQASSSGNNTIVGTSSGFNFKLFADLLQSKIDYHVSEVEVIHSTAFKDMSYTMVSLDDIGVKKGDPIYRSLMIFASQYSGTNKIVQSFCHNMRELNIQDGYQVRI